MNSATQAIRSFLSWALGSMLMREVLPKALSYPTDFHFTLCHCLTPKYRTSAQASENLDSVSMERERNMNIRSKIWNMSSQRSLPITLRDCSWVFLCPVSTLLTSHYHSYSPGRTPLHQSSGDWYRFYWRLVRGEGTEIGVCLYKMTFSRSPFLAMQKIDHF